MSLPSSDDDLRRWLADSPRITFTGRRAYRVLPEIETLEGWLLASCVPVDMFGMYGNKDDEAYMKWLAEGNGADPFYDEVIADTYVLMITRDCTTFDARCVRCRNRGHVPYEAPPGYMHLLEITQ